MVTQPEHLTLEPCCCTPPPVTFVSPCLEHYTQKLPPSPTDRHNLSTKVIYMIGPTSTRRHEKKHDYPLHPTPNHQYNIHTERRRKRRRRGGRSFFVEQANSILKQSFKQQSQQQVLPPQQASCHQRPFFQQTNPHYPQQPTV